MAYTLNDVMDFGKYEGETIGDIIDRDHDYMDWVRIPMKSATYYDPSRPPIPEQAGHPL
jgi:hypothetical protein